MTQEQPLSQNQLNLGTGNTVGNVDVGDIVGRDLHKVVIEGSQYNTHYYTQDKKQLIPRQAPKPFSNYISRGKAEKALEQAILGKNQLTNLYGLSGMGKSLLAAYVAHQIENDKFPGGTLWGNLGNVTPKEQLQSFLGSFDDNWYHHSSSSKLSLRETHWHKIATHNGSVLIILDNIKDSRQLLEILPFEEGYIKNCHILAISIQKLSGIPISMNELSLGPFEVGEALNLFRGRMTKNDFEKYKDKLSEISQELDYFPHLLAVTARDFAAGKTSPIAYLQELRQTDNNGRIIRRTTGDDLTPIISGLTPEQINLFDLIGALGEGTWSEAIIAAITLRHLLEVRQDLTVLAKREIIKLVGDNRYDANTLVREYAWRRFSQRDEYAQRVIYTLIARYCLDIMQDHDAAFVACSGLGVLHDQPLDRTSEGFVRVFREKLLPEMSHFRQVLTWATQQRQWDLLRRFSYLPHLELLQGFVANGFEVQMLFMIGTLYEPIVWSQGKRQQVSFSTLINANGCTVSPLSNAQHKLKRVSTCDRTIIFQDVSSIKCERCEIRLDIRAGHVVDGIFDQAKLVDMTWAGVRASGLIFRGVDLVGGHLLACDLTHSIWVNCDARRVTMVDSNLSYALLQNVQLNRASLHNVNLAGALLERVDLRRADLRGANFSASVLEEVDLRGADLRGANFANATLRRLNLQECRLTDVVWSGARVEESLMLDDELLNNEIRQQMVQRTDSITAITTYGRERLTKDIAEQNRTDFVAADLRGVELEECNLSGNNLLSADLRSALLTKANLRKATLDKAVLCAAHLEQANLVYATLRGTNLRAATLAAATLEYADGSYAILRNAYLAEAKFKEANVNNADLRFADLSDADLHSTNLAFADLSHANLSGAQLQQANLGGTNLTEANLTGADLTGAQLNGAICVGTVFQRATIEDSQLALVERLEGAVLQTGVRVQTLDGKYGLIETRVTEQVIRKEVPSEMFLRFAQFSGTFEQVELIGFDLFGAYLSGDFALVNLSETNLSYARLSGTFSKVKLIGANFSHAHLNGTYTGVDFTGANLYAAEFQGASLVNCVLTNAQNFEQAQLTQVKRLRGTLLPCGERYDGSLNLAGDLEDAREFHYNLDNPLDRTMFYSGEHVQYRSV